MTGRSNDIESEINDRSIFILLVTIAMVRDSVERLGWGTWFTWRARGGCLSDAFAWASMTFFFSSLSLSTHSLSLSPVYHLSVPRYASSKFFLLYPESFPFYFSYIFPLFTMKELVHCVFCITVTVIITIPTQCGLFLV